MDTKNSSTVEQDSESPSKSNVFFKVALGSALGLGLSPVAPGTLGALLGVLLHIFLGLYTSPLVQSLTAFAALILVSLANHLLTPWAREYWQNEDPRHFVLDEISGYLMVPVFFHQGELWQTVLWGFILFRLFDIIKFPPARQIDRNMKNSWGILLDDIVSGGYAVVVMYLFLWVGPLLGIEKWLITPQ
jgi:phosphatidylglycerophosphatase A